MNLDHVAEAIWRAHRCPKSRTQWADVTKLAQDRYRLMARAATEALGVPDPAWARAGGAA
jgi:hypothetical protein